MSGNEININKLITKPNSDRSANYEAHIATFLDKTFNLRSLLEGIVVKIFSNHTKNTENFKEREDVMTEYGAIFDNDGTIVDTEPLHLEARQTVLRELGIILTRDEYIEKWMARPTVVGITASCSERIVPSAERENTAKRIQEKYHELRRQRLKLTPGFREFLRAVHFKFTLAIATVQPRDSVFEGLRLVLTAKERRYFKLIVSGEDVKRNKPAPDMFLVTVEKLGIPVYKCVAFEDSVIGVQSAKNAGMLCVARASEWTSQESLLSAGADFVFQNDWDGILASDVKTLFARI